MKTRNTILMKNKLVESKISNNKDFQNHSIKYTKYLIHKIMEVFSQALSNIINNQIISIFTNWIKLANAAQVEWYSIKVIISVKTVLK